jgi:signal recognition particle subunit SRP54
LFQDLSDKFARVFKELRGQGKVREGHINEAMREVRRALLEADVNYKVVKEFVGRVSERAIGQKVLASISPDQQIIKIAGPCSSRPIYTDPLRSSNSRCSLGR